jgi:uncharacterized membrane protein YfcA
VHGEDVVIAFAGFGAGLVNGIAGGGSLVSFPALIAVGHSALVANVTSSVGIWTGYLGGVAGVRPELTSQAGRVRALAPVAIAGGLVGAGLLLVTPSDVFRDLAPILILLACALFALQPALAARLRRRRPPRAPDQAMAPAAVAGTLVAAVYGGYFGAGLGVILLAVLGLGLDDELVRINGLRGVLSLLVNTIAVLVFAVRADVAWGAAGILAGAALVGGYAGARLSRRLPTPVLRAFVITFGVIAALRLLTS